jgi:NTE family protein
MRVIVQQVPSPFPDARVSALLRPNYREFLVRGVKYPWRAAQLLRNLARDVRQISAVDLILGLADALPTGLYSAEGLERYVRRILSDTDSAHPRTDDFRRLECELYIPATDLDSCERVVFGAAGFDAVPISKAVSASSAIPMVYKPVRIDDRDYIDGGLVSTTNLDIAVEAGAKLVVVVNPLVPYVNDARESTITLDGSRVRRISEMGFPQIGFQAFKMIAHHRLHDMAAQWEQRYPGVDIILIEPDPADELMFQTNIMNFTSRVAIARHGFESVTLQLSDDYPRFKRVAARHGIEISATQVRNVVKHFGAEDESTGAWRKILEQTTSTLLRQSAGES